LFCIQVLQSQFSFGFTGFPASIRFIFSFFQPRGRLDFEGSLRSIRSSNYFTQPRISFKFRGVSGSIGFTKNRHLRSDIESKPDRRANSLYATPRSKIRIRIY